ncbi:MAG: hypothetical protein JW888_16640 [Pirellulales bacterium]|nr:hypothetical protein [Pirellulales bacterium]
MWRAFFLAIGITLCIVGVECLGLERVVLKIHEPPPKVAADPYSFAPKTPGPGPRRTIIVKEYTPFSFLALGVVVILYAYDLPRRMKA